MSDDDIVDITPGDHWDPRSPLEVFANHHCITKLLCEWYKDRGRPYADSRSNTLDRYWACGALFALQMLNLGPVNDDLSFLESLQQAQDLAHLKIGK